MAKVAILFKVYPEDGAFDKAMANIKSKLNPQAMQAEEVAFGIKLIKVMFTFEDADKGAADLEEALKKIEGVKEVEVDQESLV